MWGDLNASSFFLLLTVNMRGGEQWKSGVDRGSLRARSQGWAAADIYGPASTEHQARETVPVTPDCSHIPAAYRHM